MSGLLSRQSEDSNDSITGDTAQSVAIHNLAFVMAALAVQVSTPFQLVIQSVGIEPIQSDFSHSVVSSRVCLISSDFTQ
jgi:hypothetical protein